MTIRSNSSKKIAVVITAAGSSSRMAGPVKKEYLPLYDGTVLSSCIKAFTTVLDNPVIIVTVPKNGIEEAKRAACGFDVSFIEGGSTRQRSVLNALDYIKQSFSEAEYVLIHDGARPFVSTKLIQDVIDATLSNGAAVPGITPTDTIKAIDEQGFITTHLQRKNLTAVQTPQGFAFRPLYDAHKKAEQGGDECTDDSEIWGKYCGKVKIVPGDTNNIKITYPGDLEKALNSKK